MWVFIKTNSLGYSIMNNLYTINQEVKHIKQMRLDIENNGDRIDDIDQKVNSLVSNNFLNFDSLNDTLNEISNIKNSIIKLNEDIIKINEEVVPQISKFEHNFNTNDQIYIFLKNINYERYYTSFKNLGCETLEDILLLTERDFSIYEIPLVHTRKILKKAKYYVQTNITEINL
jgi:Zn-dependent oligopeptidase